VSLIVVVLAAPGVDLSLTGLACTDRQVFERLVH
jgi:hypothetical protein